MATMPLDEAAATRKPFYRILYVQVLIGIVIGVLVGQLRPALGVDLKREFAAIINPPQSTILAVGATQRRATETEDGVRFAGLMTITLSCDHRVVGGVLGADLLAPLREVIRQPAQTLS